MTSSSLMRMQIVSRERQCPFLDYRKCLPRLSRHLGYSRLPANSEGFNDTSLVVLRFDSLVQVGMF